MSENAPSSRLISPASLYRVVARAEAVTWALLIVGMILKYVTKTTEMGVKIGGMVHGVVFVTFVVVTVAVWIDNRWSLARGLTGLASAIPPFATLLFEANVEKHRAIADTWRLAPSGRPETAQSLPERLLAALLRRPAAAALVAVGAVVVLTLLALLVGPPGGK